MSPGGLFYRRSSALLLGTRNHKIRANLAPSAPLRSAFKSGTYSGIHIYSHTRRLDTQREIMSFFGQPSSSSSPSESRGPVGQTQPHAQRGRGRGRGGRGADMGYRNARDGVNTAPVYDPNVSETQSQSSTWRGRARGRGNGSRNNGNVRGKGPRPTHFLALPLHTHSTLRSRVSSFQTGLLETDPPIRGLDPTIVINPVRLHLTLGVMPLEDELDSNSLSLDEVSENEPKKTPSTALALLRSLQPAISRMLADMGGGVGVKVPLEHLFVFPPGATTGASVLWLGPDMRGIDDIRPQRRRAGEEGTSDVSADQANEQWRWKQRLWRVSDFIHQEFKKAGYITEQRPLKLHCTILNTSHRRPRKWAPFSYEDVLNSPARNLIDAKSIALVEEEARGSAQQEPLGLDSIAVIGTADPLQSQVPGSSRTDIAVTVEDRSRGLQPLPVNIGVYDVNEVQLWVMGSHGPNGEYISLGGIRLE